MVWARSIAVAGATAAVMLLAAPAWADVTLSETTGGKLFTSDMTGTKVTRIKGHKMRQDSTRNSGDSTSMIFDLDAGKMIILNHTKKEATVRTAAEFGEAMTKITDADMKSNFAATGETRTVAGQSCAVFDSSVSVSFSMAEKAPPINMTMKGPVCVSKNAPGAADYKAFFIAASEKGFFFTDPAQAKAQPAMAKAMQTMLKKQAEAGVPLSTDMAFNFEGDNPMAQMMSKMASGKMTTEATKVETGSIGDDVFGVPAGYKVKDVK